MVESPLDKTKCGACGTVKPGSAPSADEAKKTAAAASKFSFGGQSTSGSKAFSVKPSSDKSAEGGDAPVAAASTTAPPASVFGKPAATGKFSFGQPKAAAAAPPAVGAGAGDMGGATGGASETAKPKSSMFGGLKLTAPSAGVKTLGATSSASVTPAKPPETPTSPATSSASPSTGGGFGGFGKKTGESGAGGFAALAKSGGGFAKTSPGGKSIFDTKTKAVFGAKATSPKAAAPSADANGDGDDGEGDGDGAEGDGITADDGIRFDPVVKLTKVETSTGEEGWEELMSVPCKL